MGRSRLVLGNVEQDRVPPFLPLGNKYAVIALPVSIGQSVPDHDDFGAGMHATRGLGFPLPEHWREWIGSIAVSLLDEEEHLCLWVTSSAKHPELLDNVNERLKIRVQTWLRGLLLTARAFGTSGQLTMLTGANGSDGLGIRERSSPERPISNNGVLSRAIEHQHIRDSAALGDTILTIHESGGKYRRLRYMIEGFYRGARTVDAAERIHEFVRCVEGCILPPHGETRSKFLSRTELFIGPRQRDWAGVLYDIRSAVEHLNDQLSVLAKPTERESILTVLRHAYEVQELARYCLNRILSRPQLLQFFVEDSELQRFWELTHVERCSLWGDPLDLPGVSREFSPDYVQQNGW